jgi:O-glycosyl hydrolase
VAGHSYFSTSPWQKGVELRRELAAHIDSLNRSAGRAKGLAYWQTEYCILGDNAGEINGNKRDTGMNAALYMARVIHEDLVVGQATAWQWWLAISPYNYKDGLIYVDKNKKDGDFHDGKMLWAMGNFSRFVRPGMRRIEVTGGDDSLFVSAYKNGASGVVVCINLSSGSREVDIRSTGTMYTTSATENLEKHALRRGDMIVLPAKSISTLMIQRF